MLILEQFLMASCIVWATLLCGLSFAGALTDLSARFQKCDFQGAHALLPRMHELTICYASHDAVPPYDRDIVYYHIFKSAGTSVANVLNLYCNRTVQRSVWPGKRPMTNFEFEGAFTFTLVRDPIERFLSAYHESQKLASERANYKHHQIPVQQVPDSVRLRTFDEKLRDLYLHPLHRRNDPHYAEQISFLLFSTGRPARLDFIGLISELEAALQHILWTVQRIDIMATPTTQFLSASEKQYQARVFGVRPNNSIMPYLHARSRESPTYAVPKFVLHPHELTDIQNLSVRKMYLRDERCLFGRSW